MISKSLSQGPMSNMVTILWGQEKAGLERGRWSLLGGRGGVGQKEDLYNKRFL